ncbi:MAG TPA: chemotaxis protein CheW [Kofleriaceae bacterium]|nr:chemotaxis protein CheW [Kofleriaceae bacterium]
MLVTRVGGFVCALPIAHVVETLRPLPVEPISSASDGALAPVDGVAMIRGAAVPVVDARRLLGIPGAAVTRFVVVRAAERRVALAVDAVLDVRRIEADALTSLPPLLRGAQRELVSAIGALDNELLIVLDSARVLPDDSWRRIDEHSEVTGSGIDERSGAS